MPIHEPLYRLAAPIVQGAPENAGVYALWQDAEMIYLGRAASIKAALLGHLQRNPPDCTRGATHYSWELSLNPGTREADLLEAFRKRHGRLPRCNNAA
jgi:hypothetical protein